MRNGAAPELCMVYAHALVAGRSLSRDHDPARLLLSYLERTMTARFDRPLSLKIDFLVERIEGPP